MIRQSTIDKLHDMRLSAMSDAFECQCKDPDTYQGLSFEDRFGMLVDKEWDKRKSTKLQKLIRSAEYSGSVIPMRVWKILSIILTEIWIKDRCWNSPPAGIYLMTTISF